MTERKQFRLPDVGEGLTEADIVSWHVKPGDEVVINQVIVEIETAKAVVELPCPFDGVVADLLVAEGQTVDVGTPIIAVDVAGFPGSGPAGPVTSVPAGAVAADDNERDGAGSPPAAEERQAVLVGYGVKAGATTRRRRKTPAPSAQAAFTVAPAPAEVPADAPAASPAQQRCPQRCPQMRPPQRARGTGTAGWPNRRRGNWPGISALIWASSAGPDRTDRSPGTTSSERRKPAARPVRQQKPRPPRHRPP